MSPGSGNLSGGMLNQEVAGTLFSFLSDRRLTENRGGSYANNTLATVPLLSWTRDVVVCCRSVKLLHQGSHQVENLLEEFKNVRFRRNNMAALGYNYRISALVSGHL